MQAVSIASAKYLMRKLSHQVHEPGYPRLFWPTAQKTYLKPAPAAGNVLVDFPVTTRIISAQHGGFFVLRLNMLKLN